MLVAEGY
jgi:hypothetical protein